MDNKEPKASEIVMYANVYCFDASNSFDLNKMIEGAAKVLNTSISCGEYDPDEEEIQRTLMYIKGGSTQGIETILLKTGVFTINLPYLASRTDVALAFTLMREAKKIRPELVIYDGDDETLADLSEDNELDTYYYRLDNMANIIEHQDDHISVNGITHEFHIFPEYIKSQMPNSKPEDWTYKAFEDFVDIQWNYEDYDSFSRAEIKSPQGEEFIARILTNNKGFAGVCQKVILFDGKDNKIVPVDDFFEATKDNKYIKRLDYAQFVIDKMPEQEWKAFYDSFDVKPIRMPKTYLLRWNPKISSFKLEDYREATMQYSDGFAFDWSIYEWEEAHEGDLYYMLRTGDDKPGIVWHGVFTNDPYEGEDWAGQGKKRYYMDMDCYDCIPPDEQSPITIEKLEQAIPNINWRKGHSGELLSDEDAEKLREMWSKLIDKQNIRTMKQETKILNIGNGREIKIPVNYQNFLLTYDSDPESHGWHREDVEYVLDCIRNGNLEELDMDDNLMDDIGTFFEDGVCVEKNIEMAVYWYEQAIENGNDLARSNLADILRKGSQGYPKDLKRAFELYKACGLPYAHYRVGEFYEHGWGVKQDLEAAKAYYRQAYKEGHGLATKKLKEWNFLE